MNGEEGANGDGGLKERGSEGLSANGMKDSGRVRGKQEAWAGSTEHRTRLFRESADRDKGATIPQALNRPRLGGKSSAVIQGFKSCSYSFFIVCPPN